MVTACRCEAPVTLRRRSKQFFERALRRWPPMPGIERVATAQSTPFAPSQSAELRIPGFERLPFDGNRHPTFYTVVAGFFDTMGMRILRGRAFTKSDVQGAAPVMILEDALAKAIWPNQDAIGKCIVVGASSTVCREIVGIASNTRRFVSTSDSALRYYIPMAQRVFTMTPQALFVRTSGEPGSRRSGRARGPVADRRQPAAHPDAHTFRDVRTRETPVAAGQHVIRRVRDRRTARRHVRRVRAPQLHGDAAVPRDWRASGTRRQWPTDVANDPAPKPGMDGYWCRSVE